MKSREPSDAHALLDAVGGSGAAVAVGLMVALLSACVAFFIYRFVRGLGDENNGNETTVAAGEARTSRRKKRERNDRPTESTEECQDGKQKQCCSETINPTNSDNVIYPTEVTEKDLNESTLKDLEEITDELLMDVDAEMGDKTDSDLDHCVETDPDENTECEDHIQHEDEDSGHELFADVTQLDDQHEENLDKSESGQNVDTDEPSETESAQELIYQRHQDPETTQHNSYLDQSTDSSNPSKSQLEEVDKTSMVEEVSKKFEDHHDWRFPRTNNIDCCCYDKKMDIMEKMKGQPWFHSGSYTTDTVVNHSNKFDFHNYLGFQIEHTFIGGSSTQVQEKKSDEESAAVDKTREKNEISIMDAIMDNNEWLNVGAPEFKDRPWLKPTTEEKQEKEGQVKAGLAKDDEELANKRVATVPPLSQKVNVAFRIHYITYCPSQLVAVTGSLQELGAWDSFVPLQRAKDDFWANTITLPAESQVEWKFVLVEDGSISRWEECGNRSLFLTSQDEDVCLDKCWGCR